MNLLYYGGNLAVKRLHVKDESVAPFIRIRCLKSMQAMFVVWCAKPIGPSNSCWEENVPN